MHIAIEGLDGVGKTQTAKLLAKQYNFTFIEKPLHYLTDTNGMEKTTINVGDLPTQEQLEANGLFTGRTTYNVRVTDNGILYKSND